MSRSRPSSWLLLGVAIFVVLGHICAAPVHAHAGAVTTHSDDHEEGGADEAAHGGSCETLRASFDFHTPALLPAGIALPVVSGPQIHQSSGKSTPSPTSSPPLFLLHAALLI